MKTKMLLVGFVMLAQMSAYAKEGSGTGSHGGGAWVCRDNKDHGVRWAKLLDTFEAAADPKVKATFPSTAKEALQLAKERLAQAGAKNVFVEESASSGVCPYFASELECGMTAPGTGTILPSDANTFYRPLPEACVGGALSRETIALRTKGREISVVRELYDRLSEVDQVALALHESLYSFASFVNDEKNSDNVRPLVAKLIALGNSTLLASDQARLKGWGSMLLSRTYWVEFEFRSWSNSALVDVFLEGVLFRFKKNECVATGDAGLVLGEKTAFFRCRHLSEIMWNDASPEPHARLVLFFPDQVGQGVTQDFHLVVRGIDGDIIDYKDIPNAKAGFTKMIPLNVN